ncbi:MAG: hypothetical protein GY712_04345 [Oceanicoccus sp.]|uniref:hypothetical protein n=1 Tax=Oceanicoccus sp. TaxID=2691044 RepID=UPI0026188E2B|nr:hypothetical protein [Oceanicoccus sp.]MCP3907226.1 hypothetical protein [Oceanicoccus sp.]MDG1772575.1 hypothetical protein [Oceanicoccus sp.]
MTSIFEASAELKVLPTAVVQQFKLTKEESVLCLGLVQGKSIDDVADEVHQPREILRHQFHTLLEKTGTDTEAKLVTVVLSSAE